VALAFQPVGELARERGLPRTLQAGEQDDGRRAAEADGAGVAAEDLHEFLVDDLDDLLRRVQRGGDLRRLRPLAYSGHELAHDG
jgi:hypothetical protein